MNADQNVIKMRHNVLYQVAKLAFEGTLEAKYKYLPKQMWPGPLPTHRCCVFRERAVTAERITLAMGNSPDEIDNGNIMQIMDSACADCPISGYLVTDNCRTCVGKACMNSCRFGAISIGKHHAEIDKYKCKECGMCAKGCPFNAIVHTKRPCKTSCPVDALTYDEYGLASIDESKCIRCGQCYHSCPFGAVGIRNDIVPVIEAIKSGRKVYVMTAPAAIGQFGSDITLASWKKAAKAIGFADLYEVGLGADLTTKSEAIEWHEAYEAGELKVTSCCPAFVNLIRKHFPELSDAISTTVSPMCQLSRLIKAKEPDAVTVFIGPCIAKKSEVKDQRIEGNADYALIFSEFEAIMKAKNIELEPSSEEGQESSIFGRRYATSGGVAESCIAYLQEAGIEDDFQVLKVSGVKNIKTALAQAKAGKLPYEFIEGMCCEGGCFYGPSSYDNSARAKLARDAQIDKSDSRTISENLSAYDLESFSPHR